MEREWKITNTAFTGTFSIDITLNTTPITASDLRVMIDTDGNFSDATIYSPTITLSGSTVTISGISTTLIPSNTTRYLTLVSLSATTPLPVELMSFHAEKNVNQVDLKWETAGEINNDYFVVEKSKDSKEWFPVSNTKGAGNSSNNNEYSEVDLNPFDGISYYRLKQVDYDGHFSFSNIEKVDFDKKESIIVYPNPTNGIVHFSFEEENISMIRVINSLGIDVTSDLLKKQTSFNHVALDFSILSNGLYYVQINSESIRMVKH